MRPLRAASVPLPVGPRVGGTSSFWERAAPLLFFETYLTASVLVFAFGPLDLTIHNCWKLYPYVLCGQLAIFWGYYSGMQRPARPCTNAVGVSAALKASIVVTLILLPVTLRYRNYGGLSVMDALVDPAAAYSARLEHFDGDADAKWLSILRGTMAPVMAMFVPLGIVYWNRLSRIWQGAWVAGLVGLISTSLLSGAAIGLFDIVLTTPWMLWLHFRQRRQQRSTAQLPVARLPRVTRTVRVAAPTSRFRFRQKVTAGLITLVVVSAGVHYFSYSRQSRYGMQGNEYPRDTTGWSRPLYGVTIPESVEYPVYMLTKYWTQGYQGLSECLDLPFVWCWGVGHSPFWMRYADKFCSDQKWFWDNCYPMRLDATTGYSAANNWHTIYPWLASDLTFAGAIVFVGLLAYLLSRAWAESLAGHNPFAIGYVAQLLILFFYIPANNGRLSYPEETLAFWGLLIFWLWTRQAPSTVRRVTIRGR